MKLKKSKQLLLNKKTVVNLDSLMMRLAMGGCAEDSATSCASCDSPVHNVEAKLSLGTCADGDASIQYKPPLA